MQNNLNPQPIEGLLGEWINTRDYINCGIFECLECDIIWSNNNTKFYCKKKCPACNELSNSKYIWYGNNNLSNEIINKCSIKLFPNNNIKGYWIKTNNCKGFGYFECISCISNKKNKNWISAYANTNYEQKCIKCKLPTYPKFMWINHIYKKSDKKPNPPQHITALCKACDINKCDYLKNIN